MHDHRDAGANHCDLRNLPRRNLLRAGVDGGQRQAAQANQSDVAGIACIRVDGGRGGSIRRDQGSVAATGRAVWRSGHDDRAHARINKLALVTYYTRRFERIVVWYWRTGRGEGLRGRAVGWVETQHTEQRCWIYQPSLQNLLIAFC